LLEAEVLQIILQLTEVADKVEDQHHGEIVVEQEFKTLVAAAEEQEKVKIHSDLAEAAEKEL
jgi:hypothetical protein